MAPESAWIAGLPWYDHRVARAGLDDFFAVFCASLRARGVNGLPEALERGLAPADQWSSPQLLLSQCCGPDLFTVAGADLEPLARPVFDALGCEPGWYYSHIVVPESEPVTSRCIAINARSSWSGCGALLQWLATAGTLDEAGFEVLISGSHRASIELVRKGRAQLAAIDAHSWRMLDQSGVRVLGRSAEAPSPPWVAQARSPVPATWLREALTEAVDQAGAAIGVVGVMSAERADYAPLQHFLGSAAGGDPSAAEEAGP